jgi:aryl-phospho-beta-D-glucosidase BglC (GH1 family)
MFWLPPLVSGDVPGSRPTGDGPARLSIRGTQILTPDGQPIRLRGFNLLWWIPPTAQDVVDIKELGANCVRYQFGYRPAGRFEPEQLWFLKRHVRLFTSQGLWVILNVHAFRDGDGPNARNVWNSPEYQQEFLDMWEYVLGGLKDEPFIAAWEPINEPHDVGRERLASWYREVCAHFHQLDPRTPLVAEGASYSGAEELLDYLKLDDPNVIYSFHFYHPHEYTHMLHPADQPLLKYPGQWGKAALADRMATAVRFRDRHQVPVLCGEWGVRTGAPGYVEWLKDVGSLLEEHNIPWVHWAWAMQARRPLNDTFDLNKRKTDIYQTVRGIFERALSRDCVGTRPAGPDR